ncbi:hypothetical protein AURDEDRAFT_164168 [Auricularia subglabra TFB-10046 SS5]|nr:hypothetical protein AURDEDRAFT_164168 [Auricularia subglabra TFB-10046 SS5]
MSQLLDSGQAVEALVTLIANFLTRGNTRASAGPSAAGFIVTQSARTYPSPAPNYAVKAYVPLDISFGCVPADFRLLKSVTIPHKHAVHLQSLPRSPHRRWWPDVVITLAGNGLLLAAVSYNCQSNGSCKRQNTDDLLRRARDQHKAVAPLVPCLFSTNPREGQADTPTSHVKLHKPVPATRPYAPTTVGTADANPANVKPGKLWMISYLPACTLDASASWDPAGPDGSLAR